MMTEISHEDWYAVKNFVDLLNRINTRERVYILDTVLTKFCPTCGSKDDIKKECHVK